MKNPFQLLWQKSRRDLWLKAAIIGASAALLAVGILLLLAKRSDLSPTLCLLGVIALPVGSGLFLLLKRNNHRKFAKTLDGDFALHEKVQTMIAFEQSDTDMAALQREDTLRRLAQIPPKKLRFGNLWVYILLPVLALAMMGTAIACPEKQEQPYVEPYEPPVEITDWEWEALDKLIDYVQTSKADEQILKQETLKALRALKSLLLGGVTESSLNGIVQTTITQISNARATAADSVQITEEQKTINEEVYRYTIEKLCEIFRVENATDDPVKDPDSPGDKIDDGKWNGSGELNMGANEQMFDPQEGYVPYGNVIGKYQTEINKAFAEGNLTQEEYDYLTAYFGLLYGGKQE